MDFTGHKLVIINRSWVFDMTEYIGYKTKVHKGTVISYNKAFRVDEDANVNLVFTKEKDIKVPTYILKSVEKIIKRYREELSNGNIK